MNFTTLFFLMGSKKKLGKPAGAYKQHPTREFVATHGTMSMCLWFALSQYF
jgi:hypothetical protein